MREDVIAKVPYSLLNDKALLIDSLINFRVNLTFGADVHSANLVDLEGNTNYSIKILSFTIFEGFWSQAMYIKTPEAGKCNTLFS